MLGTVPFLMHRSEIVQTTQTRLAMTNLILVLDRERHGMQANQGPAGEYSQR